MGKFFKRPSELRINGPIEAMSNCLRDIPEDLIDAFKYFWLFFTSAFFFACHVFAIVTMPLIWPVVYMTACVELKNRQIRNEQLEKEAKAAEANCKQKGEKK